MSSLSRTSAKRLVVEQVALWNQKAHEDVVIWDYHVVLVLRLRAHTQFRPEDPEPSAGSESASWEGEAWVYDFDTRLPIPCRCTGASRPPLQRRRARAYHHLIRSWLGGCRADYLVGTFPYAFDTTPSAHVSESYRSLFRVVPAAAYLDHFASDRSHMLADAAHPHSGYSSPPPTYPPISGCRARETGVVHNLMDRYVAMRLPPMASCSLPAVSDRAGAEDRTEGETAFGEVMDMAQFVYWITGARAVALA
ncbi:uncharacterized protein FIBRA_05838 [Fibroporia radiculosa]|uniref:Protein N-terminal glutamine amidohydrolase n=1 Tax=Fibroporia radiculosa TaxID=599839 RepID=J4GA71_9APHY|nr:uncharacterized protein FIBRA_05838 [Fibroporia radiculosa]CCM03693.1 predicted protein [Fibroporia radiculosa]